MADTLKFGPEWLRALSDGGTSSSMTSPPQSPAPGITPNYKLAEHRYGREEMLALLAPDKLRVPERLKEHTVILLEKPCQPLAFISPSEDETRLLAQSVNSTAVLRLMGRGTGPVSRGGRGVAGERGRGRGRGRGEGGYFSRGTSFDDESGFGRGAGRHGRGEPAPWEEGGSRDVRFERSFSTRAYDEAGGLTSPRKEFTRSLSSENWREARREDERGGQPAEDGGDWRRAGPRDKWSKSSNWREAREAGGGFDRSFERGRFEDVKEFERHRYRGRGSGSWDDDHDGDGLPEWATDNDTDNVGTFDSSGAFMSMKEAQAFEEFRKERRARQKSEEENKKVEKRDSPRPEEQEKKEKLKPAPEAKQERAPSRSPQIERKTEPVKEATRAPSLSPHPAPPREASPQPQQPSPRQPSPAPAPASSTPPQEQLKEEVPPLSQPPVPAATPPAAHSPVVTEAKEEPHDIEDQFDHLQKAAEHLVATWTAEEDAKSDSKAKVENGSIPQDHEHAQKWFYRDPQGDLQGPFTSQEMAEWFSAGYFTMSLHVKRGSDPHFTPLGELIKIWRRLPFLPGPAPAKSATPSPPVPTASVAPVVSAQQMPAPQQQIPQPQTPQAAAANAQYIQQQVMLQQQLLLRQLQMQQMAQVLNQNKAFTELPPQQQQSVLLQMVLQNQMLKTGAPGQQQTLPVSVAQAQFANGVGAAGMPRSLSPSQVAAAAAAGFPSMPNMGAVEEGGASIWGGATPPPSSVSQSSATSQMQAATTWSQAGPTPSVWDIEPPENAKRLEDIEREQLEKQREQEEREREAEEQRRREEELRQLQLQQQQQKQKEEEERRRKEEEERKRQMEIERQKEVERQRLEQLRREQEEARRREEERRRLEEEQRRRQEEEEQRRRQEEEERRRRENEELERKRQEEIMRRQKAEEQRRQQQEALRRMQQEQQLVNMQLPSSAQWAQGQKNGNTSNMSLAEIQAIEAEQQRRDEEEKQHRLELQRQQLAALQQQQAQHNKSWTQQKSAKSHQPISLLEIQQEQAIQLQQERSKVQTRAAPAVNVPLATSAVWGGGSQSTSSHWAAEGAWGRAAAQSGGFWDEAPPVITSNKKSNQSNNNAGFPALTAQTNMNQNMNTTSSSNKNKAAKSKKDEEVVQRLFQAMKPKDEFTQWCENALKGMQTSVDIPTFIAFLQDVESPYEVHDYIRSYLGETKETTDFAKQFLARRNKGKNQNTSNQVSSNKLQESLWDMPALNSSQQNQADDAGFEESKATKKKKKRMQKVDASILGFTVQAAPDRFNIGEIDTTD